MKQFLEFLITPLLSSPEQLAIDLSPENILISVSEADAGKIIGKKGSVINSLRVLLKAYCVNHKLPFQNLSLNTVKKD